VALTCEFEDIVPVKLRNDCPWIGTLLSEFELWGTVAGSPSGLGDSWSGNRKTSNDTKMILAVLRFLI